MGSAPNACGPRQRSPIRPSRASSRHVGFQDTLVICSTTAMILMVSGVPVSQDITYVQDAVSSTFGPAGILFISIAIFFFAFSSLIGNYYYTESNLRFIRDDKRVLFIFRLTCLAAIFLGAQASS